jgi:hypothetical protein
MSFSSPGYERYASKAVYCSISGARSNQIYSGNFLQFARVQEASWSLDYPLEQVSYLDAGTESSLNTYTPVSLNIAWYDTNGKNEAAVGLGVLTNSYYTGLTSIDLEQNYYVGINNEQGADLVGVTGTNRTVVAFSQGLFNSYNLSAQVGSIVQSAASLTCLSAFLYTGMPTGGNLVPTVSPQNGSQSTGLFVLPPALSQYDPDGSLVAAVGAKDLLLQFPLQPGVGPNSPTTAFATVFSGEQACYLQSCNLSVTANRQELRPLGFVYPPNRATIWPLTVELTAEAVVSRYQADQLQRIDCLGSGMQVNLIVRKPCAGTTLFGFYTDQLRLANQSFSSAIGPMDSVRFTWRGLIGSPRGFLFSGGAVS